MCMFTHLYSIENVCEILRTAGFTQVVSHTQLMGNVFCEDTHCSNVLVFPRCVEKRLEKTKLVTEHILIIQVTHTTIIVTLQTNN